MKKWLITIIFGITLVLGACGGDDGGSEEPADGGGDTVDTAEAEGIYKDSCASCHGGDLGGGAGPDLTDIGSTLSQDEIETQIEEGGDGMPPDLVSGDDLTTLSEWLADMK